MTVRWLGSAVVSSSLALPACCVGASTVIRTPSGRRRLGELRPGDAVVSVDLSTGRLVPSAVVARRSARRECLRLRYEGGELVCTPDHPIYAPKAASYQPASRWVDGACSRLLLLEGERLVERAVREVEPYVGVREVVDLSVSAAAHNFVAAGVVVHNKSDFIEAAGEVDGPAFGLTVDERERSFTVRTCVRGQEPLRDGSILEIEIETDGPRLARGSLWYAVYVEQPSQSAPAFIDRPAGEGTSIVLPTIAGMCGTPATLTFERLDELTEGTIEFTWHMFGHTLPPSGTTNDDPLEIDVEG